VKRPATMLRPERGFTLVEVLVALLILAIAAVAVLQLFGGGLRLARASGDHLDAVLLAESKMTEVEDETLAEGVTEGTEGAFRWARRVVVDPSLLPEDSDVQIPSRLRLARVSVEVRWGRNRQIELVTVRPLREDDGS
jgi:general secretion pathway protein I